MAEKKANHLEKNAKFIQPFPGDGLTNERQFIFIFIEFSFALILQFSEHFFNFSRILKKNLAKLIQPFSSYGLINEQRFIFIYV